MASVSRTRSDESHPDRDDGIETSSNKYLAAIGGAFGWGLKRSVINLYKFVCRDYEEGDKIYVFRLGRGTFTTRLLIDLIATDGLVTFHSGERTHSQCSRSLQTPSHNHMTHNCNSSEASFHTTDWVNKGVKRRRRRRRRKQKSGVRATEMGPKWYERSETKFFCWWAIGPAIQKKKKFGRSKLGRPGCLQTSSPTEGSQVLCCLSGMLEFLFSLADRE